MTHFPSPYQVELFNEVNARRPGALHVYYLFREVRTRKWSGVPITHPHHFLDEKDSLVRARHDVSHAQFAVFNFYADARATELIRLRAAAKGRWCLWGERPGYRFPRLARLDRMRRLRALRATRQPIWGIGGWAVEAYRDEFGSARAYVNLPYYSDLTRFGSRQPLPFSSDLTFLFSGSLSHRKGVDLLARAFVRLARVLPRARLKLMGEGSLAVSVKKVLAPCASQVEWVGFRDWNDLPDVYASAHVLCVPSRHDGWGLVVAEGLATGLPVIATDRTGAALDLINPGVNGWITPARDEESLYLAMHAAASLTEHQWQAMSRSARDSVAGHTLVRGAGRFLDAVDEAERNPDRGY